MAKTASVGYTVWIIHSKVVLHPHAVRRLQISVDKAIKRCEIIWGPVSTEGL